MEKDFHFTEKVQALFLEDFQYLISKTNLKIDSIFGDYNLTPFDRKLSDKRTYPAIDVQKSGTRKEDLLLDAGDLQKVFILRKILSSMGTVDAMEFLLDKMKDCKTNEEFFSSMNQ